METIAVCLTVGDISWIGSVRYTISKKASLGSSNIISHVCNLTSIFYRHSFFYERAKKILFIRKERLENLGEFVLVIVHCLSHIATNDLRDDSKPLFLRFFYKVMS